jgi:type VI secretion system secreted protein Hcp
MAADMFLKFGEVKGEATDSKHAGEIEVLSWSWGMTQSGSTHVGTGGGAGKVNVNDINITKYVDSSSPTLIKFCCEGKVAPAAILTVRKAGGSPLEYLKLTLGDVIVSSISTGGAGGEDRLTESVTLNFAKFENTYTPQKPDGSGGPPVTAKWNIQKNSES